MEFDGFNILFGKTSHRRHPSFKSVKCSWEQNAQGLIPYLKCRGIFSCWFLLHPLDPFFQEDCSDCTLRVRARMFPCFPRLETWECESEEVMAGARASWLDWSRLAWPKPLATQSPTLAGNFWGSTGTHKASEAQLSPWTVCCEWDDFKSQELSVPQPGRYWDECHGQTYSRAFWEMEILSGWNGFYSTKCLI